jgi:general secretion pathway protein M
MKDLLARFRAWWATLAERERRALGTGAVALALILAYVAGWQPLAKARHQREAALAEARSLAVTLEKLAVEVQRRRGTGGGQVQGAGQSLLAVVDASRKASSMTKPPSRLQPEGEATVRIWLEDVPFDALLRWLNDLQLRYGVRVDNADIERESASGLVNARLTLMR